jgi:hypothetical protein
MHTIFNMLVKISHIYGINITPFFDKKMIFITQFDSPALWQIYLSDPASITMEGILMFNKHLLFLLTVIVLFVGWLLFYTIYYFIEYNNS